MKNKQTHKQPRSHPFRRYIPTMRDNDQDEFRTIPIGEFNGGNVGGVNCIFNGGGK